MSIGYEIKKMVLRSVRVLLGPAVGKKLAWLLGPSNALRLRNEVTDELIEGLLRFMDLWAVVDRDFRENLNHWRADLVLATRGNTVAVTARFTDGQMQVLDDPVSNYDTRVEFRDGDAFRAYFLSDEQDILESVLQNSVVVEGNLNHVYRFGFVARDLMLRLTGHV